MLELYAKLYDALDHIYTINMDFNLVLKWRIYLVKEIKIFYDRLLL